MRQLSQVGSETALAQLTDWFLLLLPEAWPLLHSTFRLPKSLCSSRPVCIPLSCVFSLPCFLLLWVLVFDSWPCLLSQRPDSSSWPWLVSQVWLELLTSASSWFLVSGSKPLTWHLSSPSLALNQHLASNGLLGPVFNYWALLPSQTGMKSGLSQRTLCWCCTSLSSHLMTWIQTLESH